MVALAGEPGAEGKGALAHYPVRHIRKGTRSAVSARCKLKAGFRLVFGDSIYGFILDRRMELGRQLLLESQVNVSSIAYDLGYTPAHFSVAFRKKFGCTSENLRFKTETYSPDWSVGCRMCTRR